MGVLLSLLVVGCVFPPRLSVDDQDAGVNSPPAITAVRAEDEALVEGNFDQPVLFSRGPQGVEGSLNISLVDTDVNDTLYVRVFFDYTPDSPAAPRTQCTAPPIDNSRRSVSCNLQSVCFEDEAAVGKTLHMNVMVFDREPIEGGDHQTMPEGGLSTAKFYFVQCVAEQT